MSYPTWLIDMTKLFPPDIKRQLLWKECLVFGKHNEKVERKKQRFRIETIFLT